MATLIDYILIPLDLKTIVHDHALCNDMIPLDPEVSKCNQSRWPSNCTSFHGHHVMRNSSIQSCTENWPFVKLCSSFFLENGPYSPKGKMAAAYPPVV